MRSKSRLTSSAVRRGVPLNTMCSRKCDTPETSDVSSRAPVRTKKPSATDRADGLVSPMICRPLGKVWLWNGTGFLLGPRYRVPRTEDSVRGPTDRSLGEDVLLQLKQLRPQRDDGEVARRVAAQVADDGPGRQGVDGRLDL